MTVSNHTQQYDGTRQHTHATTDDDRYWSLMEEEAMTAQRERTPEQQQETRGGIKRRGLIAGVAALATALVIKETVDAPTVAAANGDPILLGQVNASLNGTSVFLSSGAGQMNNGNTFQVIPLDYNGQKNNGIYSAGINGGTGVTGYGPGNAYGVYGSYGSSAGTSLLSAGVFGGGPNDGQGVVGVCNGVVGWGVYGLSDAGYGVRGASGSGYAVYGQSTSGHAVYGSSTNGGGVYGSSSTNVGVLGVNTGGGGFPYGVVGSVSTAPGFALYGVASVPGTAAFAAGASPGAIAGQFSGPVNLYSGHLTIDGSKGPAGLVAVNGATKNAAMQLPDGSYGLLHCVEAPEPWFEDFGEGTLSAGKATVKLEANFAATVDSSTLHVFLTAHDEHSLHVSARARDGFSVTGAPSTTAAAAGKKVADVNGTFTWRVVGKRKDVKGDRFAKFVLPQEIKTPEFKLPATPPPDKKG